MRSWKAKVFLISLKTACHKAQQMPLRKRGNKGHHNDWYAPRSGFATTGTSGTFAAKPSAEAQQVFPLVTATLSGRTFWAVSQNGPPRCGLVNAPAPLVGTDMTRQLHRDPYQDPRVCYDVSTRRWPPQRTPNAIPGARGNLPQSLRYP